MRTVTLTLADLIGLILIVAMLVGLAAYLVGEYRGANFVTDEDDAEYDDAETVAGALNNLAEVASRVENAAHGAYMDTQIIDSTPLTDLQFHVADLAAALGAFATAAGADVPDSALPAAARADEG